jgi:hypothetical protein
MFNLKQLTVALEDAYGKDLRDRLSMQLFRRQ